MQNKAAVFLRLCAECGGATCRDIARNKIPGPSPRPGEARSVSYQYAGCLKCTQCRAVFLPEKLERINGKMVPVKGEADWFHGDNWDQMWKLERLFTHWISLEYECWDAALAKGFVEGVGPNDPAPPELLRLLELRDQLFKRQRARYTPEPPGDITADIILDMHELGYTYEIPHLE